MNTEMDLQQIFFLIRRKIWLIVLYILVFGAAAYAISTYLIPPMYTATASLYVYNESTRTDEVSTYDLNTSKQLVETYIVILKSNTVLDEVSRQLEGKYSADEIREMLSASVINNTEAFEINITYEDPAVAQQIANAIVDVAPSEIIRVVKAGSVEVIDYAKLPTETSFPDVVQNTVVGLLIGLVLSILYVILRKMFDTVVHSEEDLVAAFTIPVIGVIPAMKNDEKSGGY